LQAALLIETAEDAETAEDIAAWRDLRGEQLRLRIGAASFPATLVTCRPEDRCAGTAHWVQFLIQPSHRLTLADFDAPAHFAFDNGRYQHASGELSADLRQSLLDDLELSDRDYERNAA
jgi:hypothetical protein